MRYILPTYLRTYRRRAGLSQTDLASLLGCSNGADICRYERGHRCPNIKRALACEIILHVPLRELFPGIYEEVEPSLIERAHGLHKALQRKPRTPRVERTLITVRKLRCASPKASAIDV